eukprot:Lankesteria_metandrocarpae@DN4502_c0_g1_i1.p2
MVGSTSLCLLYFALSRLELGDTISIYFTCPLFACLAAYIWLGEKIQYRVIGMAILSFVGVVLVSRPAFLFGTSYTSDEPDGPKYARLLGVLATVGGACTCGFAMATIKRIGTRASAAQLVFYMGLAGATTFSPVALWSVVKTGVACYAQLDTCLYVLGVCGMATTAQWLLNYGMRIESVGIGSMLRNLDVVFSFTWQVLILKHSVPWTSLVGSLLIVASSAVVFMSKMLEKGVSSKRLFQETKNDEYEVCVKECVSPVNT